MPVRLLDPVLVDRIAAGEVVERPASVVKELVENALDAGASEIEVVIEAGGRRLIRVSDDGCGMSAEDLELSVERHATSKIPDGDLANIATLGFRGEALPSIASVAWLEITTRPSSAVHASRILVEAGKKGEVRPAAMPPGTRVEVRDLFAATPARLKFLKTDRAEALAILDVMRRLAMANRSVRFTLAGDNIAGVDYAACSGSDGVRRRLAQVIGEEFAANAVPLNAEREGFRLTGFAGLPTFNRASTQLQYLFVNGRPVRDRVLIGAVRAAYADYLSHDRHPIVALFLDCDASRVDVNVHPAKAEVRFRDAGLVRGLIVGGLKEALAGALHRASTTGGRRTIEAFHARNGAPFSRNTAQDWDWRYSPAAPAEANSSTLRHGVAEEQASFLHEAPPAADARNAPASDADLQAPLGAARAQLHETYIIAQTRDGILLVDQHAAHERLVYERLKRERAATGIARQMLLVPAVVEMDAGDAVRLLDEAETLASLGLTVESFGPGAVAVREVPAALKDADIAGLVRDVADALAEERGTSTLDARLNAVLATMACHHSVRAGRRMKPEEMNALLREMEATPGAGQCNHGRPTYVELKLSDIERLFGRK